MGFLKGLFGKKEAPKRQLDHPNHLQKGDIISLDDSFALPEQLRGQQLRVEGVNTYEYQRKQICEWVLKGHGSDTLCLSLDEDDETYLAFSIKLPRSQVEQIFDLDAFSEIFEEDCHAELEVKETPSSLTGWLSDRYHQINFAQFGYFHRADYRGMRPPQDEGHTSGEPFESYLLLDEDETRAVEVEVYEGGDTDVSLTLYRPLSDIRQYWPAQL
ncbi:MULTISPECIES: DUF4178 domain-containing protein [Shewanella]|uniref:DUF4178 domain-containing protein n=1 Tax=Shewanella marisflavi TaxID=260364 RepID=A0ABX5WNQ5_9GAMM|nr:MULTISPECIES: DUF4178 domain-containing protein [Shewanella]QDF74199.1 DUF4178 domain-containing protein [Shewanella marisflavi]